MSLPERSPATDSFLRDEVERALAPYDALLDEDERAWLREALATEVVEDEELRMLLHAAHPRVVDESGERIVPWHEAPEAATEKVG